MTATRVQDTMGVTPDQSRSVNAKKHPVLDLFSQAEEILTHSDVLQVAVQGPPHREQSHDDDKPRETHPYVIGVLVTDPVEPWVQNGRGELIGAVIRHGEDVWMLVHPKWTLWPGFMDHLRQACAYEGPEEYAKFWTSLPQEVRKDWKEPARMFPKFFGKKET